MPDSRYLVLQRLGNGATRRGRGSSPQGQQDKQASCVTLAMCFACGEASLLRYTCTSSGREGEEGRGRKKKRLVGRTEHHMVERDAQARRAPADGYGRSAYVYVHNIRNRSGPSRGKTSGRGTTTTWSTLSRFGPLPAWAGSLVMEQKGDVSSLVIARALLPRS